MVSPSRIASTQEKESKVEGARGAGARTRSVAAARSSTRASSHPSSAARSWHDQVDALPAGTQREKGPPAEASDPGSVDDETPARRPRRCHPVGVDDELGRRRRRRARRVKAVDRLGPLEEPRRERVRATHHLPERLTRIVTFEGHDHEVTHRGRLQERALVDPGSSSGLVELLAARAIQFLHPGAPFIGLSGQDGERDCHQHGDLHGTCVPSDGGSDSPLALRDGRGDRMGDAALEGSRSSHASLRCLEYARPEARSIEWSGRGRVPDRPLRSSPQLCRGLPRGGSVAEGVRLGPPVGPAHPSEPVRLAGLSGVVGDVRLRGPSMPKRLR